jgi:transposase
MTRYVGWDLHKRESEVAIIDESGALVARRRIASTREAIERFARKELRSDDRLALEATMHTLAVDVLSPFVHEVVVSNPMRTKAIASAKFKTDKVDALVLAQLLRCDFLPAVWRPDPETRRRRELTHRRAALVADRTAIKNRRHATLTARLVAVPTGGLFCKAGLTWLRDLELDADGQRAIDADLRLLEGLEREIAALEQVLAEDAYEQTHVKLLMTLPGIDYASAQGVIAAWGDVRRFAGADSAVAYLGLNPSTRQSGDHPGHHGPITKQGNRHARWLLVQAAQHLDRHPGPLGVFFRRLARKKNRNVAVVAAARKLALVAWHMLLNQEPYRYAQPKTTETELQRLRVRTRGARRRGPRKGAPRSARYGTGISTRRVPSLQSLAEAENIPRPKTVDELTAGERRHLDHTNTLTHALSVQKNRRTARPTSTQGG